MPQFTNTHPLNRSYHIWHCQDYVNSENEVKSYGSFKCILCGAITTSPVDVENGTLKVERYEKLTDEERNLVPYNGSFANGKLA